ncbi:CYCA1-1 [Linum grandiflorum]
MSTTTHTRRPSFSSSTTSSLAKKRHASASSSLKSTVPVAPPLTNSARKRAPLCEITNNHRNAAQKGSNTALTSSALGQNSTKIAKLKKCPPATAPEINKTSFSANVVPSVVKSNSKVTVEVVRTIVTVPAPRDFNVSPSKSDQGSMSMDETMSTCDSFKSPDVEYIDNIDLLPGIDSINKKTLNNLFISDDHDVILPGIIQNAVDDIISMDTDDKIVDLDTEFEDPQLCASIACDIYNHLRATETKKRPATDFMEKVQKDVNASMRAILVDWLVEVAEEYRLVPDTLYLTVNYIDRYLSGNVINRQKLQLLGVACMMIASKYEEICAPQVEEFCYITDNTYFKDEVLDMESSVLNYLKFEMTAPTSKCFLRRFARAAQGSNEVPSMQLECLANYISELSLLEYNMLCYPPSVVAASSIFLAKFILSPSGRPWNSTLQHYTRYQPSDLRDCVKDLHRLCCGSYDSNLPAIRDKYSQHKVRSPCHSLFLITLFLFYHL